MGGKTKKFPARKEFDNLFDQLEREALGKSQETEAFTNFWKYLKAFYKDFIGSQQDIGKRFLLDLFLIILFTDYLSENKKGSYEFQDVRAYLDETDNRTDLVLDDSFRTRIADILELASYLEIDIQELSKMLLQVDLDTIIENDLLGTSIQQYLSPALRKGLAANFTSIISSKFLSSLSTKKKPTRIIDPFSGSGRLLTSIYEELMENNSDDDITIELNEVYDVSCFLSAIRLLYLKKENRTKFNLRLHLGDAFEKLVHSPESHDSNNNFQEADLVIMNPPFTRYSRLEESYVEKIETRLCMYEDYFSLQMGLHVYSFFLADQILQYDGWIAAVLPAAIFYSDYSSGLKKFILKKYNVHYIIAITSKKSFSEDSDFKEVLFIGEKKKSTVSREEVANFVIINKDITRENYREIADKVWNEEDQGEEIVKRKIKYHQLEKQWNWISYLKNGALYDISIKMQSANLIKSGKDLDLRIVRGFEMYGPNFFFLPNSSWKEGVKRRDGLVFEHKSKNFDALFSKEILVSALRKPGLYNNSITPEVNHYALHVREGSEYLVPNAYIDEREDEWQVAKNRFGENWLNHIYNQLQSKKPFGHLFLVDKFGITTTGTIIHYFDDKKTASKNFYVVDAEREFSKIVAAWMSSIFFITLFLYSRREIGGSLGRLQISDYLKAPLFIDPSKLTDSEKQRIEHAFDEFRKHELPPLREQLDWRPRKDLDSVFLNILRKELDFTENHNAVLEDIYDEVSRIFEEIDNRARSRRGRD